MTETIDLSDYKYLYSTVKIEGVAFDGAWVSGTGFYFSFEESEKGDVIGIVTNRHVLEELKETVIKIVLYRNNIPDDLNPLSKIVTDLKSKVIYHPDLNVDLCMLPLSVVIDQDDISEDEKLCIYPLSKDDFLTDEEYNEITAIEEVIMIGYPDGLIDETNYKPILRKGLTATHLKFDYGGDKEFLIDMCCFGGSSGSPVFWYKNGHFKVDDEHYLGVRTKLIGVLYAGYDIDQKGEMVKVPIRVIKVPRISIHMNIGYIIKVERILELGELAEKEEAE